MVRRKTSEGFARVMSKVLKYLVMFVVIYYFAAAAFVFGGVQLCRVGYSFACEAVGDTSKDLPPGQTKAFTISEDDGEFEVAKRLSNQDLVGNPAAFYVHMQLMKREGTDMQKGIYTLNSSMTYEEIIRVIYGL